MYKQCSILLEKTLKESQSTVNWTSLVYHIAAIGYTASHLIAATAAGAGRLHARACKM